jgi:uncharacterized protein
MPGQSWRYPVRSLTVLLTLVVGIWITVVLLLWASEPRLVFRHQWTQGWAPVRGAGVGLRIDSTDGLRLDAAALEAGTGGSAYWVLFFNGAAGSIHRRRQWDQLEQIHTLGYSVLGFDYRGFGRNAGSPSERGLYDDAMAAYRYLTASRHVSPKRVILAGRSLGSAVAVELATRVPAAGVILLSPIDSVPAMGARLYPWAPVRLLAVNRFDSLSKIHGVRMPVLIVHSPADRFVPIEVGRVLYEHARAPKLMLESPGGHNRAGFSPVGELGEAMGKFWPVRDPIED